MSVDIDFIPHLIMKDKLLSTPYDRRNSWTTSISSSSTTPPTTSWLERKLFSHFKRFFRRKSLSLASSSSLSSRRPSSSIEDAISELVDEQLPQEQEQEELKAEQDIAEENKIIINNNENLPVCPVSTPKVTAPIDSLYDYDRLLSRCIERQEHDRNEMILRCQIPISIPHADLSVSPKHTTVLNWKSYVRLFQSLKRDPHLFQQYIDQYYSCKSFINQREQLIFYARTTKTTFDNVLRKFLDDYVTCLICQTAQTLLIKSVSSWRIECQLCGSQRIVKRLKWKHH